MIETIFYATVWGLACYLFAGPLADRSEVFGWWRPFMARILRVESLMDLEDIGGFKYVVAKVTAICAKCIAGFWALIYNAMVMPAYLYFQGFNLIEYDWKNAISFVVISIFVSYYTSEKLEN